MTRWDNRRRRELFSYVALAALFVGATILFNSTKMVEQPALDALAGRTPALAHLIAGPSDFPETPSSEGFVSSPEKSERNVVVYAPTDLSEPFRVRTGVGGESSPGMDIQVLDTKGAKASSSQGRLLYRNEREGADVVATVSDERWVLLFVLENPNGHELPQLRVGAANDEHSIQQTPDGGLVVRSASSRPVLAL